MQDIQQRVQSAITKLMDTLDHSHLRKFQRDMYKCSADCCEVENYSMEELQNCTERCSDKVNHMQVLVQQELQDFQSRLQRCAMDCQDKTKDKMSTMDKSNDDYMKMLHGDMEACVLKCADVNLKLLPNMTKRLQNGFEKS